MKSILNLARTAFAHTTFGLCLFSVGLLLIGSTALLSGCAPVNDPYYGGSSGRYNDPYYNSYEYDRERYKLERERERLEDERERLEEERRRRERPQSPPPMQRPYSPPPPAPESCPPGFSPSEQKCSPQERKHGCKDIRLPGGLGCVKR